MRVGDYFHDYESEGSVSRMSQRSFEGVNGLYLMDDFDSHPGRSSSGTKDGDLSVDDHGPYWGEEKAPEVDENELSQEDISFAKEAAKAFGRNS